MNVDGAEIYKGAEDRRLSNPLFNDHKLKLGTFCTNLSGGCTISTADGIFDLNWPNTAALARLADDMEFEALVGAVAELGRLVGIATPTIDSVYALVRQRAVEAGCYPG